jgi:hypothetical protein
VGDTVQKIASTGTVRNINKHDEKLNTKIFGAYYRIDKNATKRKNAYTCTHLALDVTDSRWEFTIQVPSEYKFLSRFTSQAYRKEYTSSLFYFVIIL